MHLLTAAISMVSMLSNLAVTVPTSVLQTTSQWWIGANINLILSWSHYATTVWAYVM